MNTHLNLAVIGLGYVGLPLAVEFGKKREVLGFDINNERIIELRNGYDRTLEIGEEELTRASFLKYSSDENDLGSINVYIIAVPTPIDSQNNPNIDHLLNASRKIAKFLKQDDIVIYESTVYPGMTEEVCVPILESESGLKFNKGFFVGYSPERINPGDLEHRLPDIVKIVSGSTSEITQIINDLYSEIVTAGTFVAGSIKVAEAAKVIENTQRDVNIGLINELAIIFSKLDLDTNEVLEAAKTKWNFLPFTPGLVGGHCIGVDPYYLTYKAQSLGYDPEIILAGRKINDSMASFVGDKLHREFCERNIEIKGSKILILGLTFKENCPDIRNTKVIDLIKDLDEKGASIDVYDPWVNQEEVLNQFDISLVDFPENNLYQAIIIAVAHDEFIKMGGKAITGFGTNNSIIFDLKHILEKKFSDLRL
tara:strand:- start:449 stop:1720 length:1272 start_codon:yes stop_codon:yes gene_type:complete